MTLTYRHTRNACFVGYVTQAIVNNLSPLLFLTFQQEFSISLGQISLIITLNFAVQMLVDLLSACVPAEGGPRRINVLVGDGEALLTLDSDDLCATLYGPSPRMLDLVRTLAQTGGLCVWQPPQE